MQTLRLLVFALPLALPLGCTGEKPVDDTAGDADTDTDTDTDTDSDTDKIGRAHV